MVALALMQVKVTHSIVPKFFLRSDTYIYIASTEQWSLCEVIDYNNMRSIATELPNIV